MLWKEESIELRKTKTLQAYSSVLEISKLTTLALSTTVI